MKIKKILSVLLSVIMIMSTLTPAIVTASGCSISVESVEVGKYTSTADFSVSISGNPGISYVKLAVLYKTNELMKYGDNVKSDMFNVASDGTEVSGTHRSLNKYLPAEADASEYRGFIIDLENLDENAYDYVNIYDDGIMVDITLDIINYEIGADYSYYVSVAEAYNANGEEVYINGTFVEGAVTVVEDSEIGKYDDFTMFLSPEDVSVEPGQEAVIDLRVDNNPGIWTVRCMIVYPDALTVKTDSYGEALVSNGNVFDDGTLNLGIANLPLTSDRVLSSYKNYFQKEGIPTEGYNSLVLYYQPEDPVAVYDANGSLASITFNTDNAVEGEAYEIKVYYLPGDIFSSDADSMTFTDRFPATNKCTVNVVADKCDHIYQSVYVTDPTCTQVGYETTVCIDCGEIINVCEIPVSDHNYIDGICEYCFTPICYLKADNVESVVGADVFNAPVSIVNNPGTTYMRFAVTYKNSELAWYDKIALTEMYESVNVSAIKETAIKKYIPAGENPDEYSGYFVTLRNPSEIPSHADGVIAEIPFTLVSFEHGASYNYYVTPIRATKEGNVSITISTDMVFASVVCAEESVPEIYDDFTMYLVPDATTADVGETVSVDLRLDKNPGLWTIRCMIVFPEELSVLTDDDGEAVVENGTVFEDLALNIGIANLPLTSDQIIPGYKKYFIEQGITMEGYNSLVLYFEPEDPDAVIYNNGVIATIPFATQNAEEGKAYDINVYYIEGDIFRCDGENAFTDLFPDTAAAEIRFNGCTHENTYSDIKYPNCREDGYSNTYCADCGTLIYEEALATSCSGNIIYFERIEAACHYNGREEYWFCVDCEKVWTDEDLTELSNLKNVIIPATGSDNVIHVEAVEPSCISDGHIEYWFCADCEQFWQDEALTQLTNSKNVILPASGEHTPGAPQVTSPTCTRHGYITIICLYCDELISKEMLPSSGHSETILPAVAPTCTQAGLSEGKQCTVCGEITVAQTVVEKLSHEMSIFAQTPSTCVTNGSIVYKCLYCSYTENEVLPLESHVYENGYCIYCQKADNSAKIVVSDAKTAAGKTVNVTVALENNPGIVSMCFKVDYDTAALKLVAVEDAGILGTTAHKPQLSTPYTLTWVNDTATQNYTVNGTIVTLTFEVMADAAVGEYDICVSYDNRNYDIFDKDLNTVDFETVNGTVTVVDYIVGDVNGDGAVNKLDRVILTRYLADWDDYQEIDLVAADVNEDGEVNNLDRVILTRYLAEWEDYSELPHVN